MSIIQQVRDHFVNPANLGAELTLKEISAEIDCDNDKRLGIELWGMVNRSHELKCEKNGEGKNVYRWNDKHDPAAGGGAAKPKRAGKKRVPERAKKLQRKNAKVQRAAANSPVARWALTSDGAFVNLSLERGSHEIPRDSARALIEFVRQLDAGAA